MTTEERIMTAKPAPTHDDWIRAGRRAIARGIDVWRIEHTDTFFATSATKRGIGYELIVDERGEMHCSCRASEFSHLCLHMAAVAIFLGTLELPEQAA